MCMTYGINKLNIAVGLRTFQEICYLPTCFPDQSRARVSGTKTFLETSACMQLASLGIFLKENIQY